MAKKRKLDNKSEAEAANNEPEIKQEVKEEEAEEQVPTEEDNETEGAEVEEEDDGNKTTETASENPSNGGDGDGDGDAMADDDDEDEEPVLTLMEPFSKEQILDLLREAAENHPDVMDRIRQVSETDPVHRKIFVHGLGWDTNAEILTSVFKEYGEIEDCNAVCDKITGKSKGYGFILFKHRSGARKALKEPQKKIGSRMTACQLASAGPAPPPAPAAPPASEYTQRKIYVSNVSADIDPQKLSVFFSKFGEIEEGPLGLDKQTGKPKGFALFVYKSVESARRAMEEPHKQFEGHMLHVQKAIDGPKPNKPFHHQYQQGHHGGTGRGAGVGAGAGGSHFPRNSAPNSSYIGSMAPTGGSVGHLMAPSPAVPMGYNQGVAPAFNVQQAIALLTASQAIVNQNGPPMHGAYGNQAGGQGMMGGGYGNQAGFQNPQMGQGSGGRSQQGGGHLGGVNPYLGH